jgi:hypothetical protein
MLSLTAVSLGGVTVDAAERVRSGLQPGDEIITIFEAVNVTGPYAGEPHCLVCEHGANPVAMIFARKLSPSLARLISKLDAATAKHSDQQFGSFVVFLNEDEDLDTRLKDFARDRALKHIVLAIDRPAGPEGFKVAPDAELTVVLYRRYAVKANHAFRSGEFSDQKIEEILGDLPKILVDQ